MKKNKNAFWNDSSYRHQWLMANLNNRRMVATTIYFANRFAVPVLADNLEISCQPQLASFAAMCDKFTLDKIDYSFHTVEELAREIRDIHGNASTGLGAIRYFTQQISNYHINNYARIYLWESKLEALNVLLETLSLIQGVLGVGFKLTAYPFALSLGDILTRTSALLVWKKRHDGALVKKAIYSTHQMSYNVQQMLYTLLKLFIPMPGNVEWELNWLTTNVVTLAKTIYEEQAWDRCPILADALMDAGCEHDHLLNLLKKKHSQFGRGVWFIDKLMGL